MKIKSDGTGGLVPGCGWDHEDKGIKCDSTSLYYSAVERS